MPLYGIEETETPDFYVNLFSEKEQDSFIGIELTDLINPKIKKKEAILNALIEKSRQLFKEKHPNTNLKVFVDFENHHHPTNKTEIKEAANHLFQLVLDKYSNNTDCDFNIRLKQNIPIKCIRSISISNTDNFENWQSFGAYKVPHLDPTWLRMKIQAKNDLIPNYRKTSDQNWLVMISNYGHKSSALDFRNIVIDTNHFKFDKIYIFEYLSQIIHVIK
jgi:hypothetical protein